MNIRLLPLAIATSWLAGAVGAQTLDSLKAGDALASFSPSAILKTARPVQALPNFAQVDAVLFRSGQPTQQGVEQLAAKGVKTILKLNDNSPAETDWASAAGINLVPLLMSNIHSPSYAEVDQALAVIEDPANQPVDVHCHLGHDRTGAVVAAYRVTHGASVADAAKEALAMGYSAPGFDDITTWLNGYLAYKSGH